MDLQMHRIVILNPKGGSGKSTITTNLASFFAARDMKPTVMDLDPQGSSIRWVNKRDPGIATDLLQAALLERGIALDFVDDLGGALGTSAGGRIQILNGLAPASAFTTLVHEYAHELLHHTNDRPVSCDTRELEAEAVAFVVGSAVGLDAGAASRDYILLYRGDRAALAQSLTRIQRTAATILEALDRQPARSPSD